MNVSNQIIPELTLLYSEYLDDDDPDEFFGYNRKEIKILVDSLWEQIVESACGSKPTNVMHARRIINAAKSSLSPDDLKVVNALNAVLRDYDVLIDKSYIDVTATVGKLFLSPLKDLCSALANHPNHSQSREAKELQATLDKV